MQGLDSSVSPSSADEDRIIAGFVTLQSVYPEPNNGSLTKKSEDLTLPGLPNVKATVTLTGYSLALLTTDAVAATDKKYDATLTVKAGMTIQFAPGTAEGAGTVTVTSATKGTGQPVLALNPGSSNLEKIKVYSSNVKPATDQSTVEIALIAEAEGILSNQTTIDTVEVTIPVAIKVQYTAAGGGGPAQPATGTISSVILTLPAKPSTSAGTEYSEIKKLELTAQATQSDTKKTLNITVTATQDVQADEAAKTEPKATIVKVSGIGFTPRHGYHSIYSVKDSSRDIWANIVGQCTFAACYKSTTKKTLLCLYLRSGGSPERRYFGTENTSATAAARNPWYEISEDVFKQKLPDLAGGSLNLDTGTPTPQYNREYHNILPHAWYPLLMHGIAVGSFGSIFPNLIPKTLVGPFGVTWTSRHHYSRHKILDSLNGRHSCD